MCNNSPKPNLQRWCSQTAIELMTRVTYDIPNKTMDLITGSYLFPIGYPVFTKGNKLLGKLLENINVSENYVTFGSDHVLSPLRGQDLICTGNSLPSLKCLEFESKYYVFKSQKYRSPTKRWYLELTDWCQYECKKDILKWFFLNANHCILILIDRSLTTL